MASLLSFSYEYSDNESSTDTDVMCDSSEETFMDDLPMPFGCSFDLNQSSSSPALSTPFPKSPPSFSYDFSPAASSPSLFSPFELPAPNPFEKFDAPTPSFPSPFTPQTPVTPKPDDKHVKIIVPTPDFTALKQSNLSNRKLTRTASSSGIIPETPKKRGVNRSRLSKDATPAPPPRAPIHSPTHFSHALTPKVSENDRMDNHIENFDCLEKIGQGSFSNVFKARCKTDNAWYAIKILKRPICGETKRSNLIRELKIVKLLHHPHVLSYIFCWEQDEIVHYQTEWCEQGSLSHYMTSWQQNNPGQFFEESLLWRFLTDITLGLQHIHSKGIIHHDVKPGNIFIDAQNNLKIGDFGLAGYENADGDTVEGDSRYLAPELFDDIDTRAADIFSLGATLFELACLIEMPSADEQWNILRNGNVSRLQYFPNYSNEFKEVVDVMMNPKFDKRPTTDDILSHPKVIATLQVRAATHGEEYMQRINFARNNTPEPTPPFISSLQNGPQQSTSERKLKPKRNLMNELMDCATNN